AREVLERDVDEAAGQPLDAEVAEGERGIAVGGEDGSAALGYAASAARHAHHRRMWTGIRRQEQRADDAVAPNPLPRDADARAPALEREPTARPARTARLELDEPGPHHDAFGKWVEFFGLALRRPDESHGRHALVGARHRRLSREIDASRLVTDKGGVRLPAAAVSEFEARGEGNGLAGGRTAQLDGDRLIDERTRAVDDDHRPERRAREVVGVGDERRIMFPCGFRRGSLLLTRRP